MFYTANLKSSAFCTVCSISTCFTWDIAQSVVRDINAFISKHYV